MSATGADGLHRGRIFVLALAALFTAGAAVSVRAVTAVHMRAEYLDPTDPVHVAEFTCFLAGPAASWISGQTFQIRGAVIEHVVGWQVARTLERSDRPFTAADLAAELPRLFGAGSKRADPPPPEWRAQYAQRKARDP